MDIRALNNRSYIDQTGRTRKTEASDKVNKPSNTEAVSSTKAADDTFVIGESKKSEFNYATELLQNAKRNAYTNLREIKTKIESGSYDTVEVQNSVSADLGKDLNYLDSVSLSNKLSESNAVSSENTGEIDQNLKEKLVSSEEVLNKVSERLLNELFRI